MYQLYATDARVEFDWLGVDWSYTLAGMIATLTMPAMAKSDPAGSINVQGRLRVSEVAELDAAAAGQSIPVTRAALVSHILREWLQRRREESATGKGRQRAN